ncbi:MAG: PAS domain S-box protein [Flavobacteriales bacterium]|jgi:PAS domain S-box-containing protein|nr:PAS domain S-box protein [Flavobacteriales bacterium]MBK6894634.1 PAS domain S-box protein [Flavobacteriales bacterium]MBK7247214.1 PAS domain S-box protein [Flavobacteriales bacterium]QQS71637.1 MAG: PAS domain S-box protein [Flavobacteriales bacterium]HQV40071.1 PAS domain S-box protein [Flavobacteriales bacterium]
MSSKGKAEGPVSDHQPRYGDLLEGDLLGWYRTSVTGRMLDCNQALSNLLGYGTREGLMEIPVKEFYFDMVERQRFIEDLLSKKRLNNYEVLLKHRNGRAVHVLENVVVREEPGRASVIEGIIIDITPLRQAEMEQRELANSYRQLTERIRDGILIVQQGKVTYANPSASTVLGTTFPTDMELAQLVVDEDVPVLNDLLVAIQGGQEADTVRINFRTGVAAPCPLMVFGTITWHLDAPAVQLTLHDAETERSLMQERLRATMAEEVNAMLRSEIDEHQRTQEALLQSRRLSKSLIDSSLDMIVAVDPKGLITEFNPAAMIKFGHEAEDILGRNSRMLYADQAEFDRVQEEMAGYGAYAGEVRNITAEGKVFVSFLAASRLFDEDGVLLGGMGVSRDVTQAKRDQEALRISEERYRDLVDNATDLIHSVDATGRILFVNSAWKRTLGHAEEDTASLTVFDLLPEDKQGPARVWLAQATEEVDPTPWRSVFITKDGRKLLMEGTSSLRQEQGKTVAVRSIFRDITAANAAQEQLLKHAAKEKALFEASEHLFWTVDRRIALTSFNQGYLNMVKRLHGTVPHINTDPDMPRDLFAPEDYHDFWKGKYDEVFAGNTVRFETDRTDRNGERVCNEIYLSPVRDSEGNVVEAFGIGHEITAERVAEARVREQAAKLNAIFESSADVMIWGLDRDFRVTACNKHFRQITKLHYGMDVKIGVDLRSAFQRFILPEQEREFLQLARSVFAGNAQHHETEMRRRDGSVIWIEFFVSPIMADGVINEVSCMAHDITEKKKTEQAVMESLREKEVLLKEVHHRVKNNLQIISSIFSLQRDHVADDPRSLALLHESQNRIRSMSFIHESLYQNTNFSQVDFAQYIGGLSRNLVMSYSLTGKVLLHTELQPLMLDLDKAIPCGLILNELISNALKHAFPGNNGGNINIGLVEEEGTVRITLGDDGAGFPADYVEDRDRGLGMELVEMLIDQLDGQIGRSGPEEAQGTSYLITFERY